MTRKDFADLFQRTAEAVDFEDSVLQAGRQYLPDCALDVRDNTDPAHEPPSEYWAFLIAQFREAQD